MAARTAQSDAPPADPQWQSRLDGLEQHLADRPRAEGAGIWRIRARVLAYLIRRYGHAVDPAAQRDPTRDDGGPAAPSSEATPRAATDDLAVPPTPVHAELPSAEIAHQRRRLHDIADATAGIAAATTTTAARALPPPPRPPREFERVASLLTLAMLPMLFAPFPIVVICFLLGQPTLAIPLVLMMLVVMVAVSAPAISVIRRWERQRRRSVSSRRCARCGYNLTGLVGTHCPECGGTVRR